MRVNYWGISQDPISTINVVFVGILKYSRMLYA